ncbi:PTS lactose/cellobiose transporter subunit IIA [Serratia ficaria]|uniref:N,N'-diacetylchitobiose-specific phosphotransferase enzyme IIA component n=1 Tax=Serratia ficaria TaxID=61651 RepID=A0A240CD07_SERFI|nr:MULTISPECIES: PTS lactose/cellobiose transporter subunit IIA [Serratia]MEE4485050.1 PTS lactose/cellobiose transporter subunit IIA [Serratia ficaria]REF42253.1 PTS system cellobiose-specific IIA component [Serratia ficaria]CAI0969820.1 N,N'-diacetylchitobiose-specific phosphotransferase enzyme IIA component [Serratia ficaria]CAI0978273.1 N,N'-diacetylchitobiose-specific phosphotransferase enzyme IIA component [Serratia ficaria]CAI1141128.1 N,N'-diacetylchitobiose-specific phosphotransferase
MTEISADFESTIMELLVFSGSARSSALMALQQARAGDFSAAAEQMAESKAWVKKAHLIQTELIGLDEGCGKLAITLITVHAQDHLMNAMVIQDLAGDMIELYRRQAQMETRA